MAGFFAYPPEIRNVICTTNAIESLNSSMRKILKVRRAFPNDELGSTWVCSRIGLSTNSRNRGPMSSTS